jgi:hypothetical protein
VKSAAEMTWRSSGNAVISFIKAGAPLGSRNTDVFPVADTQMFCGTTTEGLMCRNIRTLFNFEPPASNDEIRASALQFVRKLSGFTHPSKANQPAFDRAVDEVADVARRLIDSLETAAPARDRETEAAKAKEKARERYGTTGAVRKLDFAK